VTHDMTIPLTIAVPPGEALLLELRGFGLPERERREVGSWVRKELDALLEGLPSGTPVALVDRVCDLLHDLDDLLGVEERKISYS
jgi:hypothetical protein